MSNKATVEKYYITNGDQYLGCTDKHQYTIGVPVSKAVRFRKEQAESLIPQIHDNSQGEWWIQKYYNASSKKNYVITNATKFVSSNALVVSDVTKARSFKTAADAKGYIDAHSELYFSMGEPIIVNENYEPVDNFGRRVPASYKAKQISLSHEGVVKKVTNRVSLDKELRLQVYNRDEGKCKMCGKPLSVDEFTVDHIVPLKRGGLNTMDNYQCLCGRCNKFKGDSREEEVITMMKDVCGEYVFRHTNHELMDHIATMWARGLIAENTKLFGEW